MASCPRVLEFIFFLMKLNIYGITKHQVWLNLVHYTLNYDIKGGFMTLENPSPLMVMLLGDWRAEQKQKAKAPEESALGAHQWLSSETQWVWISQEESGIGFILQSRAADVGNTAEEAFLQRLNVKKGKLAFGPIPKGFVIFDKLPAFIQIIWGFTIILILLLAPMRWLDWDFSLNEPQIVFNFCGNLIWIHNPGPLWLRWGWRKVWSSLA